MSALPVVGLLGTLDTKGGEYQWLYDRLVELGARVVVVDAGIADPSGFVAGIDVSAAQLADAGGTSLALLRERRDRGEATAVMGKGAAVTLAELAARGELDALLAVGGSGGSSIAAQAMRDLPIGFPKLLVSTMASGDVSPYVGEADVTLMYPVVDIAGINRISRAVLGNAAAAAAGMAAGFARRRGQPVPAERRVVAASMFGVTTPAVERARRRLEELGYEVLTFHATGSGGRALEALARSGYLAGVLDLTTTELADELVGGVLSAGPDRVSAAGRHGVPQVVSLGALDMVNFGPRDSVPVEHEGRTFFQHNPTVTLMRTTPAECAELGRILGAKLAAAQSPTVALVPLAGVSALDVAGGAFADEQADAALRDALSAALVDSAVEIVEYEGHINDEAFALLAADRLHDLITHGGGR